MDLDGPDERGRFGRFGGRYVPETLVGALEELERAFREIVRSESFRLEYRSLLREYAGRPTPLTEVSKFSGGGSKIYLKREDLLHGGAHKINNALGQALLARKLGKKRIIAETGAGQHGVATAMAASFLGLKAEIYMGEVDALRQSANVARMKILGARVRLVRQGSRTLKDAVNEALRDWSESVETTHYLLGSVVGPHPFPVLVRDLQSVIGEEARAQCWEREGRLPDVVVACVGGGSNAAGTFHPFLGDESVRLLGVEAGGRGPDAHSASLSFGEPGIFHGALSFVLQDAEGNIRETHSVSAGLDYPGVGPEHAFWKESGRVEYTTATDEEALRAALELARTEGIIPALESAHALAVAKKVAHDLPPSSFVLVTLSGRGDKDLPILEEFHGRGGS